MTELNATEAMLNVTWNAQNGDLADPVHFDSSDEEVRQWVTEAIRNGDVAGINQDTHADFSDFVVDRFVANEGRPHNLIVLRPKTAFGNS